MYSQLPIRLTQLFQQKPSKPLFPQQLFQLHSQLITKTQPRATILFPQIQQPNEWNLTIRHASATNPLKALSLFQEIKKLDKSTPLNDDPFVYASLIKACGKAQAFLEGKSIHCHVVRLGLDCNVNVLNSLVSFYMGGSVGLVSYAAALFDGIREKSVVSVNCMISGYVKRGNVDVGLEYFVRMLGGCFGPSVMPNYVTFVVLISGCVETGGCRTGNALHGCCSKMGLDRNIEICNVLIDLYAKSGCLFDAVKVFKEMHEKDSISWNSMIWGYANSGDCRNAFSLFRRMRIENIGVDRVSLSCLLSACAARKYHYLGRMIHAHAKVTGLEYDVSVGTALINMYAKCKKVEFAKKLFDELPKQNIEPWNSVIHAYIENGDAKEALELFDQIKSRELEIDEFTVLGLIMACRDTGELDKGIYAHSIVENNKLLKRSIVLGNALIDMFAKCGNTAKARDVFDRMQQKDVISWTSIIVGYAVNGEGDKCLAAFKQMCEEKVIPNSITFIGVLLACDHAGLIDEGKKLYNVMREVYSIKPQIEHCGCLVDMLARAGKIEEAQMFIREMPIEPNALIWRMLLNACRVHGHVNLGLKLIPDTTELSNFNDSADFVISSNVFAEAGRWADVISRRNFMTVQKDHKVAGKSLISYPSE